MAEPFRGLGDECAVPVGTSHPPWVKPSLVSSSGDPGPCDTPSRLRNAMTVSFTVYSLSACAGDSTRSASCRVTVPQPSWKPSLSCWSRSAMLRCMAVAVYLVPSGCSVMVMTETARDMWAECDAVLADLGAEGSTAAQVHFHHSTDRWTGNPPLLEPCGVGPGIQDDRAWGSDDAGDGQVEVGARGTGPGGVS